MKKLKKKKKIRMIIIKEIPIHIKHLDGKLLNKRIKRKRLKKKILIINLHHIRIFTISFKKFKPMKINKRREYIIKNKIKIIKM